MFMYKHKINNVSEHTLSVRDIELEQILVLILNYTQSTLRV